MATKTKTTTMKTPPSVAPRKAVRSTAPRRKPVPRLPRRQLTMPAGYLGSGGMATLREVLSPTVQTRDGGELTHEERRQLTLERIGAQPEFDLVGPDGVIDKARALEEVQRDTEIGRILMDVETRTLEFVKATAAAQRRRRQIQHRERQDVRSGRSRAKHR
jgi:hypothetical protein